MDLFKLLKNGIDEPNLKKWVKNAIYIVDIQGVNHIWNKFLNLLTITDG